MPTVGIRIRPLVLFVLLCTGCTLARAQSSDSVALQPGRWALEFAIGGNFTLTSFKGSTIAARYQLSPERAVRAGVSISGNTNDGTTSTTAAIADTNYGTVPGSSSSTNVGAAIVCQYLWYTRSDVPVHFFVGIGPSVSYSHSEGSSAEFNLYQVNYQGYWVHTSGSSKTDQTGLGAAGLAGVEWFANSWLSIHAEYNATIQYRWIKASSQREQDSATYPSFISDSQRSSTTSHGWNVSGSSVTFGLNVYL